ncbi:MAG: hypothetical protein IKL65_05990 [Bacilli bacterium]|nr:hypothetical protein [Bacilli bacterium]
MNNIVNINLEKTTFKIPTNKISVSNNIKKLNLHDMVMPDILETKLTNLDLKEYSLEELTNESTKEAQKSISKIDSTGEIENYTEYQEVMLANLNIFQNKPLDNLDGGIAIQLPSGELVEFNGTTRTEFCDFIDSLDEIPDDQKENLKNKFHGKFKKFEGKTISEIYNEIKFSDEFTEEEKLILKNLKEQYGLGSLILVEVVTEGDFDAVVFREKDPRTGELGDYLVSFSPTDASELGDILFDAYPIIKEIIPDLFNGNYDKIKEVMKRLTDIDINEYLSHYEEQQKEASKLALKYYKKAINDSVKINIHGYSLGGNLAEKAFLGVYSLENLRKIVEPYVNNVNSTFSQGISTIKDIINNDMSIGDKISYFSRSLFNMHQSVFNPDLEVNTNFANNHIGKLVLFNPYHAELSRGEEQMIESYDDAKIYSVSGDAVSSVFGYLGEKTKYIQSNWKTLYDTNTEKLFDTAQINEYLGWLDPFYAVNDIVMIAATGAFIHPAGILALSPTQTNKDLFNSFSENFSKIFGGPHLISSIQETQFNDDGTIVSTTGAKWSEISSYLFGVPDALGSMKVEIDKILDSGLVQVGQFILEQGLDLAELFEGIGYGVADLWNSIF